MIAEKASRAKRARRAAAGAAWLVAGGLAVAGRSASAADAAYGAYLAGECSACHRAEDIDGGGIPPLRLLPYDDLVAALREYRDGARANTAMQAVARSLGDAEIEALAAYFSGRP